MTRLEMAAAVALICLFAGAVLLTGYSAARESRINTILACYDRANTPMQLAVCRGIDRDVRFTW